MRWKSWRSLGVALTLVAVGVGCGAPSEDVGDGTGAASTGNALPADYAYAWNKGAGLPQADKFAPMYKNAEKIAAALGGKGPEAALSPGAQPAEDNGVAAPGGEEKAADGQATAGGDAIALAPKEIGGSSVYSYIDEGKKRYGIWLPPSAATWVPEEIFAFTLARLFNHGDWAAPATRLTLAKPGVTTYKSMLDNYKTSNKIQSCNKEHQSKYIDGNPEYFIGVYKEFVSGVKVGDVKALVNKPGEQDADSLNSKHSVARFLSKDGRQPTSDPVYLVAKGGSYDVVVKGDAGYEAAEQNHAAASTEIEVASQLNLMMVVDVLNNQRDRYGQGTNMNIFIDKDPAKGKFTLMLLDNGGGASGTTTKYINDFKKKVTRFHPSLAKDILALDAFVNGGGGAPFKGFENEDALKRALGYEDVDSADPAKYSVSCGSWSFASVPSYKARWDLKWKLFKGNLKTLAAHVKANPDTFTTSLPGES